jgi:hypothetical protein
MQGKLTLKQFIVSRDDRQRTVRAEIGPMAICWKRMRQLVSWGCANEATQLTSRKVGYSELLVLHIHKDVRCT